MRPIIRLIVLASALAAAAGCGAYDSASTYGGGEEGATSRGTAGGTGNGGTGTGGGAGGGAGGGGGGLGMTGAGGGSGDDESSGGAGGGGAAGGASGAATLTAGVWDDNVNFTHFERYRSTLSLAGAPTLTAQEQSEARTAAAAAQSARTYLDVALVIDTTGSMGDELEYVKTELAAISQRISQQFPNAQQRWSVIVYRDLGDAYVTRVTPFTSDIAQLSAVLAQQVAGGGGDFPEAADRALADAAQLTWRSTDTARLLFWVADARHHPESSDAMAAGLRALKAGGVKIFPIASSGIDELTEYTMRSAAQLTGGRYLFLTDDSGVGGGHKEPSISCYHVTRLADAMVRVVATELSGTRVAADPATILRTVGNPTGEVCTLSDGSTTTLF